MRSMIIDSDSLENFQKIDKGFIKEKSIDSRFIIIKDENYSYYVDLNSNIKK
jgi:hypothetical protein